MDDAFILDLFDFLKNPSITETFVDILLCAVPIWLAVMIGLVIGWSWRPRWTGLLFLGMRSKLRFLWTLPPGFGARRLWLAFTALSAFSVCRSVWSSFRWRRRRGKKTAVAETTYLPGTETMAGGGDYTGGSEEKEEIVSEKDLEQLLGLLEGKDGPKEWQCFIERTTPTMSYQAWRHDPQTGPMIYRSTTVFEDATLELVTNFFWDDEFRTKWDPMLTHSKLLEECPHTGTSIVHWIKKFPFFCSDREYVIGKRIWEAGKSYYCVTKGIQYPGVPKRDKPRRVDEYFSSWVIRPVQSRKGDGQLSACEVTLFHYEDMGIPKDVERLGVRHGVWGAVKKLHSGLRAYQSTRKSDESSIVTAKISFNDGMGPSDPLFDEGDDDEGRGAAVMRRNGHAIDWKWIVVGGTVALVFGLRSGAIGKAVLLGAGQRFARR